MQIDILKANPEHPAFPMGVSIRSIDEALERWVVVDLKRGARFNRFGAWWVANSAITEDFVFDRETAREQALRAVREAEELCAADS